MLRHREVNWCSTPPSQFLDPGDRFIPTRSLMNLDEANSLLTGVRKRARPSPEYSPIKEEYRRWMEENLTPFSDGRPFKMLVFRGTPRCKRALFPMDEMKQEEQDRGRAIRRIRQLPKAPDRKLDAPLLTKDYFLNLMDWGRTNVLVIALGNAVYLWNAGDGKTQILLETEGEENLPTSVTWCGDGETVAVGFTNSSIELWNATSLCQVRRFEGHKGRVGSLSWNHHILTSGSRDTSIINHDVRADSNSVSCFRAHSKEVCGLRWSESGCQLASGGSDCYVYIWDARNTGLPRYLHRFGDHVAAVKALTWCPFQSNLLASGGGTADHCIKFWDTKKGTCINSVDTGAQVCALEWNTHQKEILAGLGFSLNSICLWRYPSLLKIGELKGNSASILHLSQSPDGITVASAAADETVNLWKVFGPPLPKREDNRSNRQLMLSEIHIR